MARTILELNMHPQAHSLCVGGTCNVFDRVKHVIVVLWIWVFFGYWQWIAV